MTSTQPPVAARRPTSTTLHGTTLTDDFAWLRDKHSPEVLAYLAAENAFTAAAMAGTEPLQQQLYDEVLSHIQEDDDSVPYRIGDWLYWSRTRKGLQYVTHLRRAAADPTAPEQVLLDVNLLALKDGVAQPFMAIGELAVSPNGHLLAYTTDNTGFRQYTLHLRDLTTGTDLPDTAARVGSIVWAADSTTLFFTTEDEQTKRQDRLFRLALGSSPVEVFYEPDERFNLSIGRTRDRQFVLLEAGSHTTSETRFLDATTPTADFTLIAPRVDDEEYDVDHRDGYFYIRTNLHAEDFRLMRVPVSALKGTGFSPSGGSSGLQATELPARETGALAPERTRTHWQELIPEQPGTPLDDFDLFQTFLVTSYRERGLDTLRVHTLDTAGLPSTTPAAITFPDPAYEAYGDANPDFHTTTYRYGYQSLVRPGSIFAYDVATNTSTLLKQQVVPGGFDASLYTSARLWFPAADGTHIPVSLVYRPDKTGDKATAPLYLYGYGSYGYPLPLGFSAARLALLDRGLIIAYAHIRGGGELGDPWHDAGKMMAKRNTFTDFIEATEFLTACGYGSPQRVAIEGGSAGGLLMGAVVNLAREESKPTLFRVVLSHVPFVDVMNTMLDATLPLTVAEYEEWGNPNEPDAFRYMLSYSPYENLTAGPYPAMLIKTSLHDSQVMYWEPAKYVAKLRTLKTNGTPLLLHINMEAGHGGASGRYDYLKEIAFDHAFLLRELGVAP
jgi:oligopeptidase B